MTSHTTLYKPRRFCLLFLPLLLVLSGFPSSFAQTSQVINYATRMRVETGARVAILGFMITNLSGSSPKRVYIRALGPSLVQFGLIDLLADPLIELHGPGPFTTITNNNWRDTQEAEIQAIGIPPTNDLEAAIVATLPPGAYTAIMKGNGPGPVPTGLGLIEIYDLDQASGFLSNLSTRAFVGTGGDAVIAGFILAGGGNSDRIVVRGLGPSLPLLPSSVLLPDPMLELFVAGLPNNPNDDWEDYGPQVGPLMTVGLGLGAGSKESAIDTTLSPGLYTVALTGVNSGSGDTGIGLIEVWDIEP